jgi:hypothetical protein
MHSTLTSARTLLIVGLAFSLLHCPKKEEPTPAVTATAPAVLPAATTAAAVETAAPAETALPALTATATATAPKPKASAAPVIEACAAAARLRARNDPSFEVMKKRCEAAGGKVK